MATRFYFPSTTEAAPISPTPDASWGDTSILVRRRSGIAKQSSAALALAFSDADLTDKNILFNQSISAFLDAGQIITGAQTIKAQFQAAETSASGDLFLTVGIRILAYDGVTVRKTIVPVTRDNLELRVTIRENRQFVATSEVGDYTTVQGDLIVFEFGVGGDPTASGHGSTFRIGDSGVDLPEDNIDTNTPRSPWIEFTDNLTLNGTYPVPSPTPLPSIPSVASQYLVRLYDTSGILVAVFDDWISLSWEHRMNAFSTHQFSINGGDSRITLFNKDCFVEVMRRAQGLGLDWYTEYIGFHRTPQRQITTTGKRIFTSYGRGLLDLINRRNILQYAGSAQSSKSGPAETVIKEYVDENVGPGAVSPPRLVAGVTTGLSIEADAALGATWTGSRAYHKVLEIIVEIADFAGLVINVVRTGAATFEFRVKEPTDRTSTGLDPTTGRNTAGNVPITFAPELANMTDPSLTNSATEEVNAIIVLGQGQESDRAFVERTSSATSDSPWNRIEDARDARQESTAAGLNSQGDEVLEEMQARENFNCEIIQTLSCAYGLHYFHTDLIDVRFDEIVRQKQVVEVRGNVAEGQERITIELGDIS